MAYTQACNAYLFIYQCSANQNKISVLFKAQSRII